MFSHTSQLRLFLFVLCFSPLLMQAMEYDDDDASTKSINIKGSMLNQKKDKNTGVDGFNKKKSEIDLSKKPYTRPYRWRLWRWWPRSINKDTEYIANTWRQIAIIKKKDDVYFAKKNIANVIALANNTRKIVERALNSPSENLEDKMAQQIARVAIDKFNKEYEKDTENYGIFVYPTDFTKLKNNQRYTNNNEPGFHINVTLNNAIEIVAPKPLYISNISKVVVRDENGVKKESKIITEDIVELSNDCFQFGFNKELLSDNENNNNDTQIIFDKKQMESLCSMIMLGIQATKAESHAKYWAKHEPKLFNYIKAKMDAKTAESEKGKEALIVQMQKYADASKDCIRLNNKDTNDNLSDSWYIAVDPVKSDDLDSEDWNDVMDLSATLRVKAKGTAVDSIIGMQQDFLEKSKVNNKVITQKTVEDYYNKGTELCSGIIGLSEDIEVLKRDKQNMYKIWYGHRKNLQREIDRKTILVSNLKKDLNRILTVSPHYKFIQKVSEE